MATKSDANQAKQEVRKAGFREIEGIVKLAESTEEKILERNGYTH